MSKKVRKILATAVAAATMMSFAGCTINIDKDLAERIAGEVSEAVENGDIEINVDKDSDDEEPDETTAEEEEEAAETTVADTNNNNTSETTVAETTAPIDPAYTDPAYNENDHSDIVAYCECDSDYFRVLISANPRFIGADRSSYNIYANNTLVTTSELFSFNAGDQGIFIECQTINYHDVGDEFHMVAYKDGQLFHEATYTIPDDGSDTDTAYFAITDNNNNAIASGVYTIELTGFNGEHFATLTVYVN